MTQSLKGPIETISHQVDRLTIQIDDTFDGHVDRWDRDESVHAQDDQTAAAATSDAGTAPAAAAADAGK